jgi:hypothetical protein
MPEEKNHSTSYSYTRQNILGCWPNFPNDPYHDAGLFVGDLKLKEYKSNSFEWIVDDFSQTKIFVLVPKKQYNKQNCGTYWEYNYWKSHNAKIKWL